MDYDHRSSSDRRYPSRPFGNPCSWRLLANRGPVGTVLRKGWRRNLVCSRLENGSIRSNVSRRAHRITNVLALYATYVFQCFCNNEPHFYRRVTPSKLLLHSPKELPRVAILVQQSPQDGKINPDCPARRYASALCPVH